MREDMFKVIVERPRLIHGNWLGGGREPGFRQRMVKEDIPHKLGMLASHKSRKWLNENLTPLRRFLESNSGRPWDKVHRELLSGIDQRNTVQQHILTHIDNFVHLVVRTETRVDKRGRSRGVTFLAPNWRGDWQPVSESQRPLFVDPRTGILRRTNAASHRAEAARTKRAVQAAEAEQTCRVLSEEVQLRRFEDVWYEIRVRATLGRPLAAWQIARMTGAERNALPRVYDVLSKREVSRADCDRYAVEKRQLNHRELVRHGLARR